MEDRTAIINLLVKAARERNKKIACVDNKIYLCKDIVFASGTGSTFNHLIHIKDAGHILDNGYYTAWECSQPIEYINTLIKQSFDNSEKEIMNIRFSGNKEVALYE